MATYYVNKSGSDTNGGTSHGDAFLTIAKAVDASSQDDQSHTIVVGTGVYNEGSIQQGTVGTTKGKITFNADGYVICDGTGYSWLYRNQFFGGGGNDYEFNNFIFHSFSTTPARHWIGGTATFNDCVIHDMPYAEYGVGVDRTCQVIFNRCFIYNITTAVVRFPYPLSTSQRFTAKFTNTVTYNCLKVLWQVQWNQSFADFALVHDEGCIHNTNTEFYYVEGSQYYPGGGGKWWHFYGYVATAADFVNTLFWNNTELLDSNAYGNYTIQTTLSAMISQMEVLGSLVGSYANSYDNVDPKLPQPTDGLLHVPLTGGPNPDIYGIGKPGVTDSSNAGTSTWALGTELSNYFGDSWVCTDGKITLSNGKFQFIGTGTSTLTSPIYDLGAIYGINRLVPALDEIYPTNVIDYNISDSAPNRKLVEYRVSDTFFAQDNTSLAWSTCEFGDTLSSVNGRYIQIRLTFRDNGVAA